MPDIHPTALVAPGAELASDVVVGPYAVIGPHVQLGAGCRIGPHAVVDGHTTLGTDNQVFPHATLGGPPQDKKYRGEPTRLVVGNGNTFRECVTVNTGTVQDRGVTVVGDDNWIMAYVHIAHDCQVASHTILANSVQLAGHVQVGDWAILGGLTGVHQFVRIGAHAMTGAGTTLLQDLPCFVMATGNPAQPHGINTEGLKRRGFGQGQVSDLRKAYRLLYKSGLSLDDAIQQIGDNAWHQPESTAPLSLLADFLATPGRGILR